MITSQFSYYTSADLGAPQLNGISGSMIALLDAILVNGYGNKPSLGWLKPIPNYTSGPANVLGCYQQPSGSKLNLFICDWFPTGSTQSGVRDCWAVGYEYLVGLTGSGYNQSSSIGTGYGAFPADGQQYTNPNGFGYLSGSWIWRKSITTDNTSRPWVLYGDSRTFYLFVQTGDNGSTYEGYFFGDIYSLKNGDDKYKCYLNGRQKANTGADASYDSSDTITHPHLNNWGQCLARTSGGGGFSVIATKVGDLGKQNVSTIPYPGSSAAGQGRMLGTVPLPNPTDTSIYMSPIWVAEPNGTTGTLRGRMRGMWQICHPAAYFSDGQVIYGSNQYAGKKFQIVNPGYTGGFWAIEISPTIETNEELTI